MRRLEQTRKGLLRSSAFLESNVAEDVPEDSARAGRTYYIPHHAVIRKDHDRIPTEVRLYLSLLQRRRFVLSERKFALRAEPIP